MIETRPDGVTATLEPWPRRYGYAVVAAASLVVLLSALLIARVPGPGAYPDPPPYSHCTDPTLRLADADCITWGPRTADQSPQYPANAEERKEFNDHWEVILEVGRLGHEAQLARYARAVSEYRSRVGRAAAIVGAAVAFILLPAVLLARRRRAINVLLDHKGLAVDGETVPLASLYRVVIEFGRLVVLCHDETHVRSRPLGDATMEARALLQHLRPFLTPAAEYDEELAADASVRAEAAKLRERA